MEQFFIKPKEGLTVRDPQTKKPLAPAGEYKPRSAYWLRREADQDVVQCEPPAAVAQPRKATGGEAQ